MKLAIDLSDLVPPLTGVGHYTLQLTRELALSSKVESLLGCVGGRILEQAALTELLHSQQLAPTNSILNRLRPLLRNSAYARSLRDYLRTQRFSHNTAIQRADVLWQPGFSVPSFKGKMAVTVYDLSFLTYPDFHPAARTRMLEHWLDRALARADRVVTISEFSRQELCRLTGFSSTKIDIVPPAAANGFQPLQAADKAAAQRRLGLPEKFILSIGTLEPRKNLARLLAAYEKLPSHTRKHWPLVLVGSQGWSHSHVNQRLESLARRGEVVLMGYVPQENLPELMSSAALVVYPSLYEGFGMPVVEALASAVPVLTSENSAMSEVAGNAARYCDPFDVDSINQELHALLDDESARLQLAAMGPAQAAGFSWQKSGNQMATVLRRLAEPS